MIGSIRLPQGSNQVSVTGQAWPATPTRILSWVRMPVDGGVIGSLVVDGTITDDGFDVILTGGPTNARHDLEFFIAFD